MNALVDVESSARSTGPPAPACASRLCVRGICCLRPGIPGVSENIRVLSMVGRFLEHERVFVFGMPGEEQFFLSSADWMPRNLHRRVEILFPVDAEPLREQIRQEVIEPALADNAFAYDMDADGIYRRRTPPDGETPRGAQTEVFDRVVRRALQVVTKA